MKFVLKIQYFILDSYTEFVRKTVIMEGLILKIEFNLYDFKQSFIMLKKINI
mgnify:CR=1 FL=1